MYVYVMHKREVLLSLSALLSAYILLLFITSIILQADCAQRYETPQDPVLLCARVTPKGVRARGP